MLNVEELMSIFRIFNVQKNTDSACARTHTHTHIYIYIYLYIILLFTRKMRHKVNSLAEFNRFEF